jgi:hypothetical protein
MGHKVCALNGTGIAAYDDDMPKKVLHSNAMDGSEDVIVWEDDFQEEDDSDWVVSMDNESVMSDDGESDEQ